MNGIEMVVSSSETRIGLVICDHHIVGSSTPSVGTNLLEICKYQGIVAKDIARLRYVDLSVMLTWTRVQDKSDIPP